MEQEFEIQGGLGSDILSISDDVSAFDEGKWLQQGWQNGKRMIYEGMAGIPYT